jgi:hypothetical protein
MPEWLVTDLTLSFYGTDRSAAVKKFDAFVREGVSRELESILEKKRWPAILGIPSFIDDIQRRFRLAAPPHAEKPQERDLKNAHQQNPEETIVRLSRILKVHGLEISSRATKKQSFGRQIAVYILRNACHLSYSEIGKKLGGIGDSTVLYNLKRLQSRPIKAEIQDAIRKEFGIDIGTV